LGKYPQNLTKAKSRAAPYPELSIILQLTCTANLVLLCEKVNNCFAMLLDYNVPSSLQILDRKLWTIEQKLLWPRKVIDSFPQAADSWYFTKVSVL